VETPPDSPEWDGVRDRLQRAAHWCLAGGDPTVGDCAETKSPDERGLYGRGWCERSELV